MSVATAIAFAPCFVARWALFENGGAGDVLERVMVRRRANVLQS